MLYVGAIKMSYNDFFIDDVRTVTIEEYNQGTFGIVFYNDIVFESVDDLLYSLAVEQSVEHDELPECCYGATCHIVRISPMQFFHEVEQYGCHFTDKAQNEFIKFADEWNKKYQQYIFKQDKYTKILIPKEYSAKFYNNHVLTFCKEGD